jgi:long-chain acyl-CoA synthetase
MWSASGRTTKRSTTPVIRNCPRSPKFYDLVQKQIEEANKDLPLPAKIHRFVNLYKVFDADDEELTRTSKLKRAFVENRYKDIVNALYSDADAVTWTRHHL